MSSGRTAKKPGSTDKLNASCATVGAVGRLAPDSHAATAVALFSTRPARSLLRSPARCRANVKRAPSKKGETSEARSELDLRGLTAHHLRGDHAFLLPDDAGEPEHPAPGSDQ